MHITEKQYTLITKLYTSMRVCTHQRSRVESNPVQSDSWRCGSDSVAYLQWPPRQRVHTSRESRVESHESCWVKSLDASCFIFVSQTPVIRRDGKNDVEKLIVLVKDHEAIYDASRCEHRNRFLLLWRRYSSYFYDDDVNKNENNSITNNSNNVLSVTRTSIESFYTLFWHSKEWQPTFNWLQIRESVTHF